MAPHNPESVPQTTYGFVGVGVMGFGMAMNLRTKLPPECKFFLCEVNDQRRDQFVKEASTKGSVEVVQSPRELAEKAEVIITMLPRAPQVKKVFLDPENGFLSIPTSERPKFFLECSSIDTASSSEVCKQVEKSDMGGFVDAPVSGGPQGSDAGTLTFMVGGPEDLFEKALPILKLMGKEIFHCGAQGAGLATKQLNNYLGYVGYLGLCEVMSTGTKYGLDPKTLANVINQSSGMNWNSLHMNPVKGVNPKASSARDFKGGFTVELAAGVIADAAALMEQVGQKTVLSKTVNGVYQRALDCDKTKGMESRSVWKMFVEDEGKELDGL